MVTSIKSDLADQVSDITDAICILAVSRVVLSRDLARVRKSLAPKRAATLAVRHRQVTNAIVKLGLQLFDAGALSERGKNNVF